MTIVFVDRSAGLASHGIADRLMGWSNSRVCTRHVIYTTFNAAVHRM